ncbi:AbiTii domain-containing protein [Halpernia frigidisoli]|uniref:AbiTii domain-containing protein n=1 Tax=Halpernia frigidisoli TaxID=1125876 RepID=A0A1I3DLS1_9FLAO|nr:hypothetical protein [Halpernia frigidisoli]SFH87478.1 hypothetical protein SAMN05443292_0555 [Halpernia frigidisoli]
MELVSQIINELIDPQNKTLSSALLKTKVLASRIQNKELLNWADSELTGYNSVDELPEYRLAIPNLLIGNFTNGNMRYTNSQIPTAGLDEEWNKSLRSTDFSNSVTELENMFSNNDKNSTFNSPIRAEIVGLIENNWIKIGNPFLSVQNVNKVISKATIEGILSNVRNKLLDFMLKIDEEYGNITEIKELRNKEKEISKIINKTIINNNGDANILNTGDDNSFDYKQE